MTSFSDFKQKEFQENYLIQHVVQPCVTMFDLRRIIFTGSYGNPASDAFKIILWKKTIYYVCYY